MRVALREAEAHEDRVASEMTVLCREFRETFRRPRLVALTIHAANRGCRRVLWRQQHSVHGSQKFFDLFGDEEGLRTLSMLPPGARPAFELFEAQRFEVNARYEYIYGLRRSLQCYLQGLDNLKTYSEAVGTLSGE